MSRATRSVGLPGFVLAVAFCTLAGCAPKAATSGSPAENVPASTSTVASVPPSVVQGDPESARDALAQLRIDDSAAPSGYRRDEWPTWKDIDGDGCDARDQALIAASDPAATIGARCEVLSGQWVSAYDGLTFIDPSDLDIDHVVPLANAYRSGGDAWSTERRALYANAQDVLWAVSAASNRSKGDRGPEEWRPPAREIWCGYATRWVQIKVGWELTATTAERDALGQMLDSCVPS